MKKKYLYGCEKYLVRCVECSDALLTMLCVLTGELSGLVLGGRPTKVTLLASSEEPDRGPAGSFLNSSALHTSARLKHRRPARFI